MNTRMSGFTWILAPAVVVLLAPALQGCGGSKNTSAAASFEDQPWEVTVESPLDSTSVPPAGETASTATGTASAAAGESPMQSPPQVTESAVTPPAAPAQPAPKVPDPQVFTPGWRVQIFASASMVNADALAAKARAKFTEPVYVEYEPPLYKVRVGDFLTKREAETMKTRVLAEDFDAYVVESLVVRPKR
jgi:cell division septation protein DedD